MYTKSSPCEPSSCKISRMHMYVHTSNHSLVQVTSIYGHLCASPTSGYASVYFTVQYCVEYSTTLSLFQA